MESYDRLFPNQDTVPRGGFGDLIALPVQGVPVVNGNSIFLDQHSHPYDDQWLFLSRLKRQRVEEAERIVRQAMQEGGVDRVRISLDDLDESPGPPGYHRHQREESKNLF